MFELKLRIYFNVFIHISNSKAKKIRRKKLLFQESKRFLNSRLNIFFVLLKITYISKWRDKYLIF